MALESSVISGEGLPSGSSVGRWPTAMTLPSGGGPGDDLFDGFEGDAVGGWDDQGFGGCRGLRS